MNKSELSFADRMVWSAFLIVLAVLVIFVDFKLERPPLAFKSVVITILLLIATVLAVKAWRRRKKPERGVCDVCGAERLIFKDYILMSGIKVSESITRTAVGQDVRSATYSDLRSHQYQSCGACERKKYVFRFLALVPTIIILMLFGLIWPEPKGSKLLSETLTFLSLLSVGTVFYVVRFLCPVGKLEKKAVAERMAEGDPKNKRKWEAFG